MRSLAARATARNVYADLIHATRLDVSGRESSHLLLSAVASRPGWTRRGDREFVHTFGSRQSAIAIPARFDATSVAALVVRAEINTILGDCDWPLIAAFQDLAARELQKLATPAAPARP